MEMKNITAVYSCNALVDMEILMFNSISDKMSIFNKWYMTRLDACGQHAWKAPVLRCNTILTCFLLDLSKWKSYFLLNKDIRLTIDYFHLN